MKSVVVTGVSTGIGKGTAKVLIRKGFRVFGSVRNFEDGERLSDELGERFMPLFFDVTNKQKVQAAAEKVRNYLQGNTLFGLVNNAGIAKPAPLMYQNIDDFRFQLEVNLVGQLIVTQEFLPLLGTDKSLSSNPGRIINISSVGGKIGPPFLGAYAASKHSLEGFSESLRRELMIYGIDVIVINPGSVATPIWEKAKKVDASPYEHTDYARPFQKTCRYMISEGQKGYSPERIGKVIWKALSVRKPRTRYLVVPGHFQNWTLPTKLPKRWVDKIIASQMGLSRRKNN